MVLLICYLINILVLKFHLWRGLNGVIFVEAVHYFPFILINLITSLNNTDRSMVRKSAQSLGFKGFGLFKAPSAALNAWLHIGASLVFLKVFDDLGTPLLLDINNMLAPQAYLESHQLALMIPWDT